jgi:hypothetical protein
MRRTYNTGFYEFGAYNTPALYGYGTDRDADLYEDYLNLTREINLYHRQPVSKYKAKELGLADRDDIVALEQARDWLDEALEREDEEDCG